MPVHCSKVAGLVVMAAVLGVNLGESTLWDESQTLEVQEVGYIVWCVQLIHCAMCAINSSGDVTYFLHNVVINSFETNGLP